MALFTHAEYLKIVDTTDKCNIDDFVKIEKDKEETYLVDLIGSGLITKLNDGKYSELLPLVKKCLAKEIQIFFVNYKPLTPFGAVERKSDYATYPEYKDKELKVSEITKVLRSYERQLIELIEKNEYPEAQSTMNISRKSTINITSIGD